MNIIYEYINQYPNDYEKYKKTIDYFINLIEYLIKINKEGNSKINGDTNIYDIFDYIKSIKDYFKEIFKDKKITVKKISNLYDYYLQLIFKFIKEDIKQYQKEKDDQKYFDENITKKCDEIFSKKDRIIDKDSLITAIRLFISVYTTNKITM